MILKSLGILILIIGLGVLVVYLRYFIPLRPKEDGFEFVYVEEDGSVRELNDDEVEYLKEEFSPGDGARPYIKSRYSGLTPDKKIWGFLARNRVPKEIRIRKNDAKRGE